MLSKRRELPNFGKISSRKAPAGDLSCLLRGDPTSRFFDLSQVGNSPTDLVNLMIAKQRRLGCGVIDMPYQALVRNMKALLKQYDADLVKRGIVLAAWTSENPFSTKYVEECIKRLLELSDGHIQHQGYGP